MKKPKPCQLPQRGVAMCSECKIISLTQQSSSSSTSNKNENDPKSDKNDNKEEEDNEKVTNKSITELNEDKSKGKNQTTSITT